MKDKNCKTSIDGEKITKIDEANKTMVARAEERIKRRLEKGVAISACGYNEYVLGKMIIETKNHISFENFLQLMNDEAFVLEMAQLSFNPLECENYFYQYVDKNLKKKLNFRINFLKSIILNDNVYKMNDVLQIIQTLGFEKEAEIVFSDVEFKQQVLDKLKRLQNHTYSKYRCSGKNPKELHKYKIQYNDEVVLVRNKIDGVKSILTNFKCLTEQEKIEKEQLIRLKARQYGVVCFD